MASKILIALITVVITMVLADDYQPSGYGGGYAPSYDYGPDNAQYYYNVYNYDPYYYKNANLKFNRYPGGAAYQLNEDGQGSYVNVNVETYRAGYNKGY